MALREFTDDDGRDWRMWATFPTTPHIRPELVGGWLSFESGGEKRRLAPVPDGWEDHPVEQLRLMLRAARGGGAR